MPQASQRYCCSDTEAQTCSFNSCGVLKDVKLIQTNKYSIFKWSRCEHQENLEQVILRFWFDKDGVQRRVSTHRSCCVGLSRSSGLYRGHLEPRSMTYFMDGPSLIWLSKPLDIRDSIENCTHDPIFSITTFSCSVASRKYLFVYIYIYI